MPRGSDATAHEFGNLFVTHVLVVAEDECSSTVRLQGREHIPDEIDLGGAGAVPQLESVEPGRFDGRVTTPRQAETHDRRPQEAARIRDVVEVLEEAHKGLLADLFGDRVRSDDEEGSANHPCPRL